ncbi:MAG: hypothetical protein ACXVA9_06425 [Bdellovibrionales bacterium]
MTLRRSKLIKAVACAVFLFTLAQAYTNCSSPYQLLVQGSTMAANDIEILKRLTSGGKWQIQYSSYDQPESSTSFNHLDSIAPASVPIDIGTSGTGPTTVNVPTLKQSFFQFQSAQSLATSANEAAMAGDSYTIVALVDASSVGNLISLNNGTRGMQEMAIEFPVAGMVKIVRSTTPSDSTTLTQSLDSSSGPMLLSVSFGPEASDISIQINGKLVTATPVTPPSPGNSSFVLRQLMLGDAAVGTAFQLGEIDVFTAKLTPASVNTVARTIAKKWGIAGMTYIPQPKEEVIEPPPSPQFIPVQKILQEKCLLCHGPGDANRFADFNEEGLAYSRFVVRGNAAQSLLYSSLSGNGGDMPRSPGTPLSADEITSIKTWINGLQ